MAPDRLWDRRGQGSRPRQLVLVVPAARARQKVPRDLVRQPRPAGLAVPRLRVDLWAGGTAFANLTLGADWSLRTLCALRTCWTNRTGRAGLARGTGRTLCPWLTAAPGQCKEREGGGDTQKVAHGISPSKTRETALSLGSRSMRQQSAAALWGAFPDWVKMKNPAAPTRIVRPGKIGADADVATNTNAGRSVHRRLRSARCVDDVAC
jgi:hypothetical protein